MVCKNRGIYGFLGTSWVLITMAPRKIGCLRRIWLGQVSWQSVSCIKPIPSYEKILAVGKSDPIGTFFDLFFFLGLGWPWVGGVRQFHDNIFMFSNPTEKLVHCKYPSIQTAKTGIVNSPSDTMFHVGLFPRLKSLPPSGRSTMGLACLVLVSMSWSILKVGGDATDQDV